MTLFKRLFSYAQEKKTYLILAMLLSAMATILSFLPYYYFWQLLKEVTGDVNSVIIKKLSMGIFLSTLLYAVTYFFTLIASHIFAFRVESNMRKKGLRHLLKASFSFFDQHSSGRTRKIIDDNASNTHTIIAHILPDSVNAIFFPICLIGLSFWTNFSIGILVLLAILFALLCFKWMYSDKHMMKDYMEALEDINSETVEYVCAIQVVKIFNMALESFENLHRSILRFSKVVIKQSQDCKKPFVSFQTAMMSFSALIIVIAYQALTKGENVEKWLALTVFFLSFSLLLYLAFQKIMFFNQKLEQARDAVEKLDAIFDQMATKTLKTGSLEQMPNHTIDFSQVSFEYEKGRPVLKDFDLHLEEKKTYALVGASGSGKSTIAKLISGFYPLTSGELAIGGHALTDYSQECLESSIAFVFQNAKLFKTSIYENVLIGKPNSSYQEVMRALQLARCQSILDKFEAKEETIIGSRGVHLSGGEVQRIAIARAILKNAPILILDEASAASDPENEYDIQKAFQVLMQGKTVIMIAHHLSSIRQVDEVLLVANGKVMERGSHNDLMAYDSRYRKLQEQYALANEWRISE